MSEYIVMPSRTLLRLVLLVFLAVRSAALVAEEPSQPQILVYAAASLTDALREIAAAYEKTAPVKVTTSFDASSSLARQIEQGASADVFFSADIQWMDYLQSRGLIRVDA